MFSTQSAAWILLAALAVSTALPVAVLIKARRTVAEFRARKVRREFFWPVMATYVTVISVAGGMIALIASLTIAALVKDDGTEGLAIGTILLAIGAAALFFVTLFVFLAWALVVRPLREYAEQQETRGAV